MHIGLIVGIGPAATDYYYRHLISALARAGQDLDLTMAHADTRTLLQNQSEGNVEAQVDIYRRLTERLQRSGIERIAVTSIAGHFCIDTFKEGSPVPVIDLLEVHEAYVSMASAGIATPGHREVFMRAGNALTSEHGCESIMLAGTDLALVFRKGVDPGFDTLDCAEVHAAAIANAAMTW
jgi:aspartate racemase